MSWLFLWDNIKHYAYKKEHYLYLGCFYGTTLSTEDKKNRTLGFLILSPINSGLLSKTLENKKQICQKQQQETFVKRPTDQKQVNTK